MRPWCVDLCCGSRGGWTRGFLSAARHPPEPSLALVEACRRIAREAGAPVFVLEDVRAAQRWLGPAVLQREGRYLWGDVALAPRVTAKPKEAYSSVRRDLRAEIPFDLAYGLALAYMDARAIRAAKEE